LPYVRPKYQAITTKDETPRLTVIRAPEVISDTKAWLEKYKPKQIAAEPVSNPAVDGRDENPCDSWRYRCRQHAPARFKDFWRD